MGPLHLGGPFGIQKLTLGPVDLFVPFLTPKTSIFKFLQQSDFGEKDVRNDRLNLNFNV